MTTMTLGAELYWCLQQEAKRAAPEHCESCDGYGCMLCDYEPTRSEAECAAEEARQHGDQRDDERRGT